MKLQHPNPNQCQASLPHPLPQPSLAVWRRSWVKSSVNEAGMIMMMLMMAKMLVFLDLEERTLSRTLLDLPVAQLWEAVF